MLKIKVIAVQMAVFHLESLDKIFSIKFNLY